MTPDKDLDVERLAEMAAEFLETPYGKYAIAKLAELYNQLHHDAEAAESVDVKAFKVERAAGLRLAMDLLMNDVAAMKAGYFKKQTETPAEQ